MKQIDYKAVAEYCKNEYPQIAQKIISISDDVLNNKFIFDMPWDMERTQEYVEFNDKIDWNYKLNDDFEFLYQLNRHNFFCYLAQAYYLTDNVKYLEKLCGVWNDFLDNVPYTKGNTPYRSLEVGMRCSNWLQTIEMIKGTKYYTKELRIKIDKALKEHVKILLDEHSTFHITSNWGIIQDSGLFLLGAYFNDLKVLDIAANRLNEELSMQILNDGVHWEQSCGYHNAVLFSLIDVVVASNIIDYNMPFDIVKKVSQMALVNVKWIKPDRCQPLLGDSDNNNICDVLSRCALVLNDTNMKYLGFENLDWDSAFYFGMDGIENYKKIPKNVPLYKSVQLKSSGQCIYRNSWDLDACYLHFMNGKTGGGHSHADKLSVMLSLNGRDVLVDSGRYTYKNNKKRRFIKSAIAHNTTILKNNPFLVPIDSWQAVKPAQSLPNIFEENENVAFIEGSHLGYVKKGLLFKRSIIVVKPDIFIILDSFIGKGSHKYSQYYHFSPLGKINIDSNSIIYSDSFGDVLFDVLANNYKIKPISSIYSKNYNSLESNCAAEIQFKGKDSTYISTVIYNKCGQYENVNCKLVTAMDTNGQKYSNKTAYGIVINTGNDEYTVCVANKEMSNFFTCNNKKAFERITVYKNESVIFKIS